MANAIIDELMIWNSVALSAEQVADAFYALGENLFVVHNVRDGMNDIKVMTSSREHRYPLLVSY